MNPYHIALMVGSVRPASLNRRLAHAIEHVGGERFRFDDLRIDDLPFFNQDIERAPPEQVVRLKDAIRAADAVLVVTPEYNRSIPGMLKNAIDWASRPYGQSAWTRKPAAVAGATTGKIGTAAAQQHLRNILSAQDTVLMGQPEFYFQFVEGLIDADGKPNEATAKFISTFLDRFAEWIDRHGKRAP